MARNDDPAETLWRIFSNPLVTAGLAIASVALLPLAAAMQWGTPEARERFRKRMAKDNARRAEAQHRHELWRALNQAEREYFASGGRGHELLRELGTMTVGPAEPFPDAVREKPVRGGPSGFRVRSASAGAELEGGWDRDGCGGLRLKLADGTFWSLPTFGESGRQYDGSEQDLKRRLRPGERPRFDLEAAEITARLLAAVTGRPERITLLRPDYFETRHRLREEFVDAHPELETDLDRVLRQRRNSRRSS